jgi:glycerate kinase
MSCNPGAQVLLPPKGSAAGTLKQVRVVIAPDKFAGTLSAAEAAAAIAAGWRSAAPTDRLVTVPVADGGEGFLDAIAASVRAVRREVEVRDPLGRAVQAAYLLTDDRTALIECAAAAGLRLVAREDRDPRLATSAGVGELMLAALDAGATRLVVGLGGSATNDGGAGLAQALGLRLLDAAGRDLPPGGAALAGLVRVDGSGLDPRLASTEVVLASDVDSPLTGPSGATAVFGPQKGADPTAVVELDAALGHWADVLARDRPATTGLASAAGAGAAGGLGFALLALCSAAVRPGIELVIELTGLRAAVAAADLVVTGEGRLDGQSLRGKAPAGVAALAQEHGLPCVAIAGQVDVGRQQLAAAGISACYAVADVAPSLDEAMADAAYWVTDLAARVAREWTRR